MNTNLEQTFRQWSKLLSDTEAARADNAEKIIKNSIKSSKKVLRTISNYCESGAWFVTIKA